MQKQVYFTATLVQGGDDAFKRMLEESGFVLHDYSKTALHMDKETYIQTFQDADAIIAGVEPLDEEVLSRLPNLKIISRRGVGYDTVDLNAAKAHNICVTRTAGVLEYALAELVISYMLTFARKIPVMDQNMRNHRWEKPLGMELRGATLGIFGMGGIGRELARLANVFGMNILYHNRRRNERAEQELGVQYVSFEELLKQSDFLSINAPLTEQTRGVFDFAALSQMKKTAYLINTARGPLVDTPSLVKALEQGVIAGAATDVYDSEPCTDTPLSNLPNTLLTPHCGPFTAGTFKAMNDAAAKNIIDFFAGHVEEKNLVSK